MLCFRVVPGIKQKNKKRKKIFFSCWTWQLKESSELTASRFWCQPSWLSGLPGAQMNIMVRTLWVSAVLLQISGKAVSSVGNRPSIPEYHRCFLPLLFNSQEPGANPLSPHKNGFIHSPYWKKKSFKHCSLHFKIFILIPESLRGKTLEPTTSCV